MKTDFRMFIFPAVLKLFFYVFLLKDLKLDRTFLLPFFRLNFTLQRSTPDSAFPSNHLMNSWKFSHICKCFKLANASWQVIYSYFICKGKCIKNTLLDFASLLYIWNFEGWTVFCCLLLTAVSLFFARS